MFQCSDDRLGNRKDYLNLCGARHTTTPAPRSCDIYLALQHHHRTPCYRDIPRFLGCTSQSSVSTGYYDRHIVPARKLLVATLNLVRDEVINWDERKSGLLALWNHVVHFDQCFTYIRDGYPICIPAPGEWEADTGLDGKSTHSGKYGGKVLKGEVLIGFHGLIHGSIAPVLGVDHDARIAEDHMDEYPTGFRTLHRLSAEQLLLDDGEWGLGDLAYVGCERCLTGDPS